MWTSSSAVVGSAQANHFSSCDSFSRLHCNQTMSCRLQDSLRAESAAKAAAMKLNKELQELINDLRDSAVASEAARDVATAALQEYQEQVSVQQASGFCCPQELVTHAAVVSAPLSCDCTSAVDPLQCKTDLVKTSWKLCMAQHCCLKSLCFGLTLSWNFTNGMEALTC